jgi:DNA-binding GntR family transcriptional regulator
MARVGIGRTPLREALNRLEAERLVNIFPRRGTFAADINLADLALICARSRGPRRRPCGHGPPPRNVMSCDCSPRPHRSRHGTADGTRHHHPPAVYAAAHNHFLEDTATQYHNLAMRIWHLFTERIPDLAHHIEEHRELLEAIDLGDDDRARAVAIAHVRGFEAAVRSLI